MKLPKWSVFCTSRVLASVAANRRASCFLLGLCDLGNVADPLIAVMLRLNLEPQTSKKKFLQRSQAPPSYHPGRNLGNRLGSRPGCHLADRRSVDAGSEPFGHASGGEFLRLFELWRGRLSSSVRTTQRAMLLP